MMKNRINNNKGIIQLEVVMVLFILGILISFTIPTFKTIQTNRSVDDWIDLFLMDYYWAQQEAISSDKWVEIVFNNDQNYYLIRNERGVIKTVRYSKEITIKENLLNHRLIFNALGRLATRNGTVDVISTSEEQHLVIQLVTGQIHVER